MAAFSGSGAGDPLGCGGASWPEAGGAPVRRGIVPAAEGCPAEPVAAEPVAAEPVAAELVAAEPVAAEPVAAESDGLGPGVAAPPAAAPAELAGPGNAGRATGSPARGLGLAAAAAAAAAAAVGPTWCTLVGGGSRRPSRLPRMSGRPPAPGDPITTTLALVDWASSSVASMPRQRR